MTASPRYSLKQRIDSFLVAALLAAMPINMLTELGRASGVFYALAIVCLTICFSRVGGLRATLDDLKEVASGNLGDGGHCVGGNRLCGLADVA